MTFAVLTGIFIDKSVSSTSSHSSSEDALSFRTGPFAGFFALFESLNCAGCQGGTSSLNNALLAFITFAASITSASAMATATT
jgi:hypothetical protein